MQNVRWSALSGHTTLNNFSGNSNSNGSPVDPASNQGVDEFVFDSVNGTFATFQEPVAMSSILNGNTGSCSFII